MRVSTLLVLGVLIAGAPFIARNAGVWRNDLHEEKARVTASLHARLESETAKLAAEQLKALDLQAAIERRRRRKQLARERARSAAALRGAPTWRHSDSPFPHRPPPPTRRSP